MPVDRHYQQGLLIMFPITTVRSSMAQDVEYLGTKSKFWYRDGERLMLFKAEERGTGEDWAEKIASELCALLGLPHVRYEMAIDLDEQRPGVVCGSITPPPLALAHGNQLLLVLDPDYPADGGHRYRTREHTISAVFDLVERLQRPASNWCENLPEGITSAAGVFSGYLMLDAWIANQDRHHENWAAVWDGETLALAPTFDHGASLARNLSDDERYERLNTRDRNRWIPHFAARARSAFYLDRAAKRPLSTFDAWLEFARQVPDEAEVWQERLASVEPADVVAIIDQVPPSRMSSICRRFTLDLLSENRQRLLD